MSLRTIFAISTRALDAAMGVTASSAGIKRVPTRKPHKPRWQRKSTVKILDQALLQSYHPVWHQLMRGPLVGIAKA
jgi:hypothetical protein